MVSGTFLFLWMRACVVRDYNPPSFTSTPRTDFSFHRGFAGVGGMLLMAVFRMLLEGISLAPFRLDC